MLFKRILASLIIFNMVFLTACSTKQDTQAGENLEKVTVVLDWTPNTNHTGLYVAKDKGYYRDLGLDVEIIQPPEGGALSLVAGEKADFGISFEEEVLVAVNADVPLPITAVAGIIEHNTGGILSLKEKNITSFKDLEGKSYGTWEIPIYDQILADSMKSQGGDISKVTMVPNSATDTLTGMQNDFDAVWVYEGWDKVIADLKGIETNFIPFTSANPVFDYYTPVIVTNNALKQENPELVDKFLQATKKGYEFAKQNPEKSAEILVSNSPELEYDTVVASQMYLSKAYYEKEWGKIDTTRWNAFFEWMKEKEFVNKNATNNGL